MEIQQCIRCQRPVKENFCGHCGQAKKPERLDGKYVLREIGTVFNFQSGILFSIRELLLRPGSTIRTFIQVDRNLLVKPILFILLSSFLYTLVIRAFDFQTGNITITEGDASELGGLMDALESYYGYFNLLIGLFIALWIKLLFRRFNYTLFEILILMCYTLGVGTLFHALFGLAEGITGWEVERLGAAFSLIYFVVAGRSFFEGVGFGGVLKLLLAYMLGSLVMIFLVIGLYLLYHMNMGA